MTLEEKVDAILSLCITMVAQIQNNTDEIRKLRNDVPELSNYLRREGGTNGQKRIDERLAIMTDQIAGNHSRTKSIVFPALTEVA